MTSGKKKKAAEPDEEKEVIPKDLSIDGNVQLNKFIKKAVKNNKKKQLKLSECPKEFLEKFFLEKRTDKLTEAMDFNLASKMEQ